MASGMALTVLVYFDIVLCYSCYYDFLSFFLFLYPGSAGGNTVGVAPCANIYGLKIFDDSGGNGYSSYIINALNVVKQRHVSNPNAKSVVSMSLSGYCGTNCASNPINQLISTMDDLGILFAVAASNNYNANACLYFPASSPKAITVAASDSYDNLASYSNTGPCVDIIGPGSSVNSACATCTGKSSYVLYSGTSMATPHVAGTLALLLQKKKVSFTTAPDVVKTALLCDAVKDKIQNIVAQSFGTCVNLLLQVPKNDSSFGSCLTDPTAQPSFRSPTATPIYKPSFSPTLESSKTPSKYPSVRPSFSPIFVPTKSPSKDPSVRPSSSPIFVPTKSPSKDPSVRPSFSPSFAPTKSPSKDPSVKPTTSQPSKRPTRLPTV